MSEVSIETLPIELTDDDAIEAAYRDDLDLIQEKLNLGISVLVECEKQLTVHLFKALRNRFKAVPDGMTLRLLSGHSQGTGEGPQVNQTLMQRLLQQLQQAVFSGAESEVIVLPHLDILTTTTRSGLSVETREAAALMYENPNALYLGFKDPSFELPKVIESVFALKLPMIGLSRDKLVNLVCQREARKFSTNTFNAYSLYKYVSGLNAIRLRQILRHFSNRLDFSPANPKSGEDILTEIRQMTLVSDVDLPKVDLEDDIGGYTEVKEKITKEILDLIEVKESIEQADQIRHIEEIVPKGIIFWGPPGTGKTLFAKAIATALDATVTIVSGPELKSKWVGESEENLRRVFAQARKSAPALIVFDELDSFAAARGTYAGSGVEHSMVNQMLTEMDGFRKEEMVFVIGTTNFVESLDSALMRPGRFELSIHIPAPKEKDRKAIIEIYEKKFGIALDEDVRDYAVERTSGFADQRTRMRYSGDHLYAMMRGLKREQLRRNEVGFFVTNKDIDAALNRTGETKRSLTTKESRTIALHEAGHAILAYVLPNVEKIRKITIDSDNPDAIGYVMRDDKDTSHVQTKAYFLDSICVALGGREAERLMIGDISSGAHSDLQQANHLARLLVEELGMGSEYDSLIFTDNVDQGNGSYATQRRQVPEETAKRIDAEVNQILKTERERAFALLTQYKDQLIVLGDRLVEEKTLGLKDVKDIFGGVEFKPSDPE